MPVDQQHCRDVFKKLDKELGKMTRQSRPERVHKFRTSTRRVETVLEELTPKPIRQTKKMLKELRRLRRKAGKVRDLDVQIGLLRNLKVARGAREKSQLLHSLAAQRAKRDKKLAASLDKNSVRDMRQSLRRALKHTQIPPALDPLSVALHEFSEVARNHGPLTEKILHQYRIIGKRARYIVEMASKAPETDSAAAHLKKMQDVVGDWHDWLTLTECAENLFGGIKDSPLVAAMRNLTRAKFREAASAVTEAKSQVLAEKPVKSVAARKAPVAVSPRSAAAA